MGVIEREISQLSGGTAEQVVEIVHHLKAVQLRKGQFLHRAGSVCRQYFFLESGAVRLYYHKDENDYTVWIGTAGQIFTDLESYLSQLPSRINMEVIESISCFVIDKAQSDALAAHSNAYNTLLRRTVEMAFVNLSKNVISFQSDEAEERYRRVLTEKNWLAHFPLKYISSFIGVTQSSLSRIRARKT